MPMFLLIFLTIYSTCFFQLRLESIIIPRYVTRNSRFNSWLSILKCRSMFWALLCGGWKRTKLDFLTFYDSLLAYNQVATVWKKRCFAFFLWIEHENVKIGFRSALLLDEFVSLHLLIENYMKKTALILSCKWPFLWNVWCFFIVWYVITATGSWTPQNIFRIYQISHTLGEVRSLPPYRNLIFKYWISQRQGKNYCNRAKWDRSPICISVWTYESVRRRFVSRDPWPLRAALWVGLTSYEVSWSKSNSCSRVCMWWSFAVRKANYTSFYSCQISLAEFALCMSFAGSDCLTETFLFTCDDVELDRRRSTKSLFKVPCSTVIHF